ncbi:MAG: hypothetical protein ACI9W2_004404, partial [Gammaproteobacteria bacterium]
NRLHRGEKRHELRPLSVLVAPNGLWVYQSWLIRTAVRDARQQGGVTVARVCESVPVGTGTRGLENSHGRK